MAMTTENKVNEEQMQNNAQAVENTQPAETKPAEQTQTGENKESLPKRIWNKAKKPLAIAAAIGGAFGLGMATDHFVVNKKGSSDESSEGSVETTENSAE